MPLTSRSTVTAITASATATPIAVVTPAYTSHHFLSYDLQFSVVRCQSNAIHAASRFITIAEREPGQKPTYSSRTAKTA